MYDEYGIKPVLARFNIDNDEIVSAITQQLDKVCGTYMDTNEGIKKAAFIEMACYLKMAIIDHETKGENLKKRIQYIIDAI